MLEIKPLEPKDYESKYRSAYWHQLSLPQDGMWEVFAQMAGYRELIWGSEPCGFTSVNEQNQLLHFFVMPVRSKNSCGVTVVVFEQSAEPFPTGNRSFNPIRLFAGREQQ